MKNKKAFTLIEILMVTIIVGILAGVLFKTYITISQISFRVEQQKYVNQELLFVSEILQNFANKNKIDYSMYSNLNETNWIVDILYMTWEDGNFSIYSQWSCVWLKTVPSSSDLHSACNLVVEKDGKVTKITDFVYVSKTLFKIIPYMDSQQYLENPNLCQSNYLACLNDHGFWFFTNFYAKWYNPNNWSTNVSLFVQQFFNI